MVSTKNKNKGPFSGAKKSLGAGLFIENSIKFSTFCADEKSLEKTPNLFILVTTTTTTTRTLATIVNPDRIGIIMESVNQDNQDVPESKICHELLETEETETEDVVDDDYMYCNFMDIR